MRVQVFDPPLCCPTGVCGPAVDPALTRFSADLDWLASRGVVVERFNLAQQPQAFLADPTVAARLREGGEQALPLIVFDGQIIASGEYLSREALAAAVGIESEPARLGGLRVVRLKCAPGSGCC